MTALQATPAAALHDRVDPAALPDPVRQALVDRAALRCALAGYRRIALFGAGAHTRRIGLEPWLSRGLDVVAILDERPQAESMLGCRVCRPDQIDDVIREIRGIDAIDAVVLSSDAHEPRLAAAADAEPALAGIPIVPIYDFPAPAARTSTAPQPRRVRVGSPREIARLRDADHARLNFGCGDHALAGWTNIDGGDGTWYDAPAAEGVIALDAFAALELLPDGCARHVTSEHFFEHFSFDDGHRLLAEWFRVLRPGGVLRIACPDLAGEAALLTGALKPAPAGVIERHRLRWLGDRYVLRPGERLTAAMVFNYGLWLDGHRFVYDLETITQSLALAGFVDVTRCRFGQSAHEALRGIDRHDGGETGRSWIPDMALIVEATKPAVPAGAHSGRAGDAIRVLGGRAAVQVCTDLHRLEDRDVPMALAALHRDPRRSVLAVVSTTGADVAGGGRRDRAWWDRRFFEADFRKHPAALRITGYERLEREPGRFTAAYEKVPPEALRAFGLSSLGAERDLHMDMLRETGRRSDAHLARYELARELAGDGGLVLDAACGLGYGTAVMRNGTRDGRVIGVDVSRYAVEYARACYGVADHVSFRLGDVTDLGFLDDGTVDLVASFETLEHLAQPGRLLAEAHRVLRPGGRIIVSVPNDWTDETGRDPNPQHLHEYDWAKLRRQLSEHFDLKAAWAQTAGGGMKLTDRPRSLRRVDPDEAAGVEAEWWIAAGRKDPGIPSADA